MFEHLAQQDFDRAASKAFWRKLLTSLTGRTNQLLPFDEVRQKLPVRGQHSLGIKQVPLDTIVGSFGRYLDFDRAFLPVQKRTKERWVAIDIARYKDVNLPPVDLYKIGEIYFVKDGNHRVSVARELGQEFIDAHVIEIDVPVRLTADTRLDELELKRAQANFLLTTNLDKLVPEEDFELTQPSYYYDMLAHIKQHRWYMGEKEQAEIPYDRAVISWYEEIFSPLLQEIQSQELLHSFPGATRADLILWIMDYLNSLQYFNSRFWETDNLDVKNSALKSVEKDYPLPAVRKLLNILRGANWLESKILEREKIAFFVSTRLHEIHPDAQVVATLPGQYERLLEHIAVHRYYMGQEQSREILYQEAVASWYDNVYKPLADIIHEQGICELFPIRTDTDLYLWVIEHQAYLQEKYGGEIEIDEAAEQFVEDFSVNPTKKMRQKKN